VFEKSLRTFEISRKYQSLKSFLSQFITTWDNYEYSTVDAVDAMNESIKARGSLFRDWHHLKASPVLRSNPSDI
jgi:hypothetical protein